MTLIEEEQTFDQIIQGAVPLPIGPVRHARAPRRGYGPLPILLGVLVGTIGAVIIWSRF